MAYHNTWRVVAYYMRTGLALGEVPVSSFSYTDEANRNGSFTMTCPLGDVDKFMEPGKVAVVFERDDIPLWSGVVWGAQVSRSAQTVTFTGSGWTSVLDRIAARFAGDLSTWAGDGSSASGFSQVAQSHTLLRLGGNTTVSNMLAFQSVDDRGTGITPPTSTQPDRSVSNGQSLGDFLNEMAGVEFDYRWVPEYSGSDLFINFQPYYPMTGVEVNSVLDDTSVVVDQVSVTADSVAHRLWGSPSWGGSLNTYAITNGTTGTASLTAGGGYPYYEKFMPATGGTVADADAYLASVAGRHVNAVTAVSMVLLPHGPIGLGQLAPFHCVTVRVDDGWLSVDEQFRIMSTTVSVDGAQEVQSFTTVAEALL